LKQLAEEMPLNIVVGAATAMTAWLSPFPMTEYRNCENCRWSENTYEHWDAQPDTTRRCAVCRRALANALEGAV
jgi:hypothetical protein